MTSNIVQSVVYAGCRIFAMLSVIVLSVIMIIASKQPLKKYPGVVLSAKVYIQLLQILPPSGRNV
jgi:hypothetical protein